jgi:clan AA aspartic protease (TIGR02281 family)
MSSSRLIVLIVACVALTAWAPAFAADALKDAGLSKSGSVYVLPDEAPVLDGIKALRLTKTAADKETRARTLIDNQIAAKRKLVTDDDKEWHRLETRLSLVTDASVHNNIVLRMNRLVGEQKDADAAAKDLETQAGKLSSTNKIKFVDDLTDLNSKAEAVAAKYQALAGDAGVKAALAKIIAVPKPALGPSPDFIAAVAEMKKWQSAVESEAIPLHEKDGIHEVDVLLNGTPFVMTVDTAASDVTLPAEMAEKLQLVPGEKDPTVQLRLANGAIIEGKEMSLKSVRVGRFTLENVSCVVLQKGLPDPPSLLGASFLNHFIVNMDAANNQLHLTEVKDPSQMKATTRESK